MALVVQLYDSGRSAERHDLGADATVRGADRVPIDVLVADLSQTGCLFVSTEPLRIDTIITIGIAGVGLREARIVRHQDVRFGCIFLIPLTAGELAAGLSESQTVALFPMDLQPDADAMMPAVDKMSRRARLMVAAGLAIASWAGLLWIVAAGVRMTAGR